MRLRNHGPAVWCALRGHLSRVDLDGAEPLEDWTPGGVRNRGLARRVTLAERLALWACVVLALLAVVGSAVGR